jgi:hypothetical protein
MATNKPNTKSASKLTKTTVKRRAPKPTPITEQPVNFAPLSSILGVELLKNIRMAFGTRDILEERGSPKRAARAHAAAHVFSDALSYVPPRGPREALGAAILIRYDVNFVMNGATDAIRGAAADRISRRVTSLASWIQKTHSVDRDYLRLDRFCHSDDESRLLPHAASTLDVGPEHDG